MATFSWNVAPQYHEPVTQTKTFVKLTMLILSWLLYWIVTLVCVYQQTKYYNTRQTGGLQYVWMYVQHVLLQVPVYIIF